MATTTATHDSTCLFNLEASVSALNQYIEDKVNSMFADEPGMLKCTCDHILYCVCFLHIQTVVKTIYIGRDGDNNLKLQHGELSASVSLADPSEPATSNNLLAYRPNYQSGLAGVFINLEGVFPCSSGHGVPACSRFTVEEDGFNGGKAILQAGDSGNNFNMFNSTTYVYGFAIQGCAEFGADCFPNWYEIRVVCLLPRLYCK